MTYNENITLKTTVYLQTVYVLWTVKLISPTIGYKEKVHKPGKSAFWFRPQAA